MFRCMRTTIRMDDDLIELAKAAAAKSGRSFTRFVEDAVRHQLALEAHVDAHEEPDLLIFAGTGLLPGVDVDSNAALLSTMDEGG